MKKLIYGMFILVVVLGIALFVMLPKDSGSSSGSSSSGGSGSGSQGHTCYVCGESGNMKYGSYYYCKTHWAMVKTVDEAG